MENISCSIWSNIITGSFTLIAAGLGAWLAFYFVQKKETKQCRRVAAAIMKAFLSEIQTGLKRLELACQNAQNTQLPDKAWTTYEGKLSIPIIDVCLQCHKNENISQFSINDFLQHLKNYYEYIAKHAQNLSQMNQSRRNELLIAAKGVEHMVDSIVHGLEN